jgi:hypothetical protein
MKAENIDMFDHTINVGQHVSEHYETFITHLRELSPFIGGLIAAWVVYGLRPAELMQWLEQHGRLDTLLWHMLLGFSGLMALFCLFLSVDALVWLFLERRGMAWVKRNGHNFRVTHYRREDHHVEYDRKTRVQRVQEERHFEELRMNACVGWGAACVLAVVAYVILPFFAGYEVAPHHLLGQPDPSFYNLTGIDSFRLVIFCFAMWQCVPAFAVALLDYRIYRSGAQFINGARVLDPYIREVTLETLQEQMTQGDADFVPWVLATRALSRRG